MLCVVPHYGIMALWYYGIMATQISSSTIATLSAARVNKWSMDSPMVFVLFQASVVTEDKHGIAGQMYCMQAQHACWCAACRQSMQEEIRFMKRYAFSLIKLASYTVVSDSYSNIWFWWLIGTHPSPLNCFFVDAHEVRDGDDDRSEEVKKH